MGTVLTVKQTHLKHLETENWGQNYETGITIAHDIKNNKITLMEF
jgi:hypothetical protein